MQAQADAGQGLCAGPAVRPTRERGVTIISVGTTRLPSPFQITHCRRKDGLTDP